MGCSIYWFRADLRLLDNPQFVNACQNSQNLLPIFILPPQEQTPWGFDRISKGRLAWLHQNLRDLRNSLEEKGSTLFVLEGDSKNVLPALYKEIGADALYCEVIAAPEEGQDILELQRAGLNIHTQWQSTMLDPQTLGMDIGELPDVFTNFRQWVEKRRLKFAEPVTIPQAIPPLPSRLPPQDQIQESAVTLFVNGGESHALRHLEQYCERRLPDTYKETRNALSQFDASSKFSPWLAVGSISARTIAGRIHQYEEQYGANDGTYWLWFELLWRDYFRFLMLKYGKRLFSPKGLSQRAPNTFDPECFYQWSTATTGVDLIDAGMRELAEMGFLSNRMRQIVASHWIYAMNGNWQAGAAWFESCLIDYDVYSNQGNWLYIAGHGTDPRGGRAFNVAKQIAQYDADGSYRKRWLS
ncbi:DASH family cryptochrome [Polynucleobacter sp. HIN7]|uniref:DASH family cryptochrome n=1 Tax=Polynucleobacter sp. HIN7 TaxID=3047866 RepID=UPI00257465AE|nr:DASH family cryptochrome [Polynucleobacter sp. HIN7]BEI37378.1 DASH family cryptochrome [Polynucleobacter sp. HIN7]